MTKLLIDWSNTNSHSYNLEGLATMLSKIKSEFQNRFSNLEIEEIALEPQQNIDSRGNTIELELGKALKITKVNNNPDAHKVLLMGHMDTVYPIDSPFQECKQIDNDTINGPGVADLKGGLVVMLNALQALEASPHASNIAWQVFINPDEEIGSPGSSQLFKDLAERNDIGLVYEPSLSDGSIAYRRKGAGNFTLVIKGKAAHVGREFDKGASAIVTAADFVSEAHKLNSSSVIINFGKIDGGGPLNIVPDLASVGMNIRIENNDDAIVLEEKLKTMLSKINKQQNISAELHGSFNRKPKIPDQATDKLYDAIASCAAELGQEISKRNTGGCCDGNNLLEHGLANIDTLGVRGGDIHSDQEFICLESLIERSQLSALLLCKLASGEIKL